MKQLNLLFKSAKAPVLETCSTDNHPKVLRINLGSGYSTIEQNQESILESTFKALIIEFFPDREDLFLYKITWSKRRQKRTLASCNIRSKKILVARELNHPNYYQYLNPLVYHELCHAVLAYSIHSKGSKTRWHGREFRELEKRHPDISLLNKWIKDGGWRQAVRSHRARTSKTLSPVKKKNRKFNLLGQLIRKFIIK